MTLRSWVPIQITGPDIAAAAVAASDTFTPNDHGFWEVINASGGSINAVVVVPGTTFGQANPDVTVAVPDGARRFIGPFVVQLADNTGLITVTHSGTSGVTGRAVTI